MSLENQLYWRVTHTQRQQHVVNQCHRRKACRIVIHVALLWLSVCSIVHHAVIFFSTIVCKDQAVSVQFVLNNNVIDVVTLTLNQQMKSSHFLVLIFNFLSFFFFFSLSSYKVSFVFVSCLLMISFYSYWRGICNSDV